MKPISSPSLKPLLFISSLYSNKSDDDTILLPSSLDLNDNILNDDESIENKDKDNNNNNNNSNSNSTTTSLDENELLNNAIDEVINSEQKDDDSQSQSQPRLENDVNYIV